MPDPRRPLRLCAFPIGSHLTALAAALALLLSSACHHASNPASRPLVLAPSAAAPTSTHRAAPPASPPTLDGSPLRDALLAADHDTLAFHTHITTLANPFFEGRSADTRGNRLAAEYLHFYYSHLDLLPAFTEEGEPSFEQPFTVPGDVVVDEADLALDQGGTQLRFEPGVDFNPLGFSGSGEITGPLVFVGYAVEDGPADYSNFTKEDDLTGKIAVMFRFEPMTPTGKSKWATEVTGPWSRNSGLTEKIAAAASHGASAIILINPPGADDPRARELDSPSRSRFGAPVAVPVALMTTQAGSRLLKAVDPQGRDAMDFRKLADDLGDSANTHPLRPTPIGRPDTEVTLRISIARQRLATNNVGAILRGKGRLADQFIVLGAHYDHVGYGYLGGAMPANQGLLHPGADDNASGTAALLILAQHLKDYYHALPENTDARSILFLSFSAEEMGLLGSAHFVKNSPIDAASIYTMINIDMVGHLSDAGLEVGGTGTAQGLEDLIKPSLDNSRIPYKTSPTGIGPSDHASFHRAGATVLFFFTGTHPDYHRPGDEAQKANCEGAVRVINLIANITQMLATRPEPLVFKQTSGAPAPPGGPSRSRAKVRLGIMPGDYSGDQPGVLIGDVFEGASAALAGIIKDDRLTKWNGRPLADVPAMMAELNKHNPGDIVSITLIRAGAQLTLPVTLQPAPTPP